MKASQTHLALSFGVTLLVAGAPLAPAATPEVVAWGSGNWQGQTNVPAGLSNVVALAAGSMHSLALTAEGRVVAWGGVSETDEGIVPSGLSNVVAIAAGGSHSLALTAEGRVVGWGLGGDEMRVPDGLSNVVAIAVGSSHGLALTGAGQVVAWGSPNADGAEIVPAGLSNVVAIAAGGGWYSHSLALTADGRVVGWGLDPSMDGASYRDSGPSAVPGGLRNVVAIATSDDHALALTAYGRVVAWGWNGAGQTDVPSGLSNVVAIAAGGSHSLALTADGQVVAWGSYHNGQEYVPWTVPPGLSNVVAIAAGWEHSLALRGSPPGTAVPSWTGPRLLVATVASPFHRQLNVKNGAEAYGAAGLPPGLTLEPTTGLITGAPAATGDYTVTLSATNRLGACEWTVTLSVNAPAPPVIVSRGVLLAGLGSTFSYPLRVYNAPDRYAASGLPTGWAMDAQTGVISGVATELGDFPVDVTASNQSGVDSVSLTLRVSPVLAWGHYGGWLSLEGAFDPMTVAGGLSNVVAIAAGSSHSLALSAAGQVWAWGGYFGYFDDLDYVPVTVPAGLSNVVAIAAGFGHSLALTAERRVVAWDVLPDWVGKTEVPDGLSNVVAIAAGGRHSLALTADGQVVAWGANWVGQSDVPAGLSKVVAIAAGGSQSLALTADGQVVAWGGYHNGREYVPSTVPPGLSNVVAIAAADDYTLALTSGGHVVGWGDYWRGSVPDGLSDVVAIAAGEWGPDHSLALTAEGKLVAWGSNGGGLNDVASGLSNVVAIAAGAGYSLALFEQPTVPSPLLVLSRHRAALELQAAGPSGIACQLLRASRLPGPWLPTQSVTLTKEPQLLRVPDANADAQFFRLLRR